MTITIHDSVAFGKDRPEDDVWGYMAVSMLGEISSNSPALKADGRCVQAINAARLFRRRPTPKNKERLEDAITTLEGMKSSYATLMLTEGLASRAGPAVNIVGAILALCKALLAEDPSEHMRKANAYCRLLGVG